VVFVGGNKSGMLLMHGGGSGYFQVAKGFTLKRVGQVFYLIREK